MNTSLDDEIKRHRGCVYTARGLAYYATVLLISLRLFGGLYAGIRLLE